METFELRYFLGVAQHQNLHRAAEKLNISPGSLSKAISRLETELNVRLFSRKGRNIIITDHGRLLQRRAAEIIRLEETARLELSGELGSLQVVMAGSEILLSEMGIELVQSIQKKYPRSQFEFKNCSDEDAVQQVRRGEAHIALITSESTNTDHLSSKVISETIFETYAGPLHPLYKFIKSGKSVPIETILEHSFVSPDNPVLGQVGARQSLDGWRDDRFPRKIAFLTSSLKIMEELVSSGKALAYLPDYYGQKLNVSVLKTTGCNYVCKQKVRMIAKNPKEIGWLNQLF